MKKSSKSKFNRNFHNLTRKRLAEYKGSLTFLNDFPLPGAKYPLAVCTVGEPEETLWKTAYLGLYKDGGSFACVPVPDVFINKNRKIKAAKCLNCDFVVYSTNAHSIDTCKCNRLHVNGGANLSVWDNGKKTKRYQKRTIDLLTNKVYKKKYGRS